MYTISTAIIVVWQTVHGERRAVSFPQPGPSSLSIWLTFKSVMTWHSPKPQCYVKCVYLYLVSCTIKHSVSTCIKWLRHGLRDKIKQNKIMWKRMGKKCQVTDNSSLQNPQGEVMTFVPVSIFFF